MAIFDIPSNLTLVQELIPLADTFTGGILGTLLFVFIGISTFILTSRLTGGQSITITAFVLTFASLILYLFNILNEWYLFISVMILCVGIIFSMFKTSGGA